MIQWLSYDLFFPAQQILFPLTKSPNNEAHKFQIDPFTPLVAKNRLDYDMMSEESYRCYIRLWPKLQEIEDG